MILSRRKAHFYAAVTLAATLPVVFLAGLLLRPSIPTVDTATDELFAAANFPTDNLDPLSSSVLSDEDIQVLAKVTSTANGPDVLDLVPQIIQFSDVLVYWQQGDQAPSKNNGEAIEDRNVLLGQLSGNSRRRFRLPAAIKGQKGHLILYSRGQDTLIASFPFTLAPSQP